MLIEKDQPTWSSHSRKHPQQIDQPAWSILVVKTVHQLTQNSRQKKNKYNRGKLSKMIKADKRLQFNVKTPNGLQHLPQNLDLNVHKILNPF